MKEIKGTRLTGCRIHPYGEGVFKLRGTTLKFKADRELFFHGEGLNNLELEHILTITERFYGQHKTYDISEILNYKKQRIFLHIFEYGAQILEDWENNQLIILINPKDKEEFLKDLENVKKEYELWRVSYG